MEVAEFDRRICFGERGKIASEFAEWVPDTGPHSLKIDKIEFVDLNMAAHLFVELAS